MSTEKKESKLLRFERFLSKESLILIVFITSIAICVVSFFVLCNVNDIKLSDFYKYSKEDYKMFEEDAYNIVNSIDLSKNEGEVAEKNISYQIDRNSKNEINRIILRTDNLQLNLKVTVDDENRVSILNIWHMSRVLYYCLITVALIALIAFPAEIVLLVFIFAIFFIDLVIQILKQIIKLH